MGVLKVKAGVDFGKELAPAGARILEVLKGCVETYDFDVTITSARDGVHSKGSAHYAGEAFDLRVHGLTKAQIRLLIHDLKVGLYRVPRRFYVVHEVPGTPNAHLHCQRRKGTVYTVQDYLLNT